MSPDGPKEECYEIACELRSCVGAERKGGIGGFGWDNVHLLTCVNEKLAQRKACQAFEKAPHAPVAGASTAAMPNEKLQVDLVFSDDIIAPRVMDVPSKYLLLIPVRTKNPLEVWDAF